MNKKSIFRKTKFLKSSLSFKQLPSDVGFEIAFCGSSNSGKSSVINSLTENKNLARTSKTPGRTQMLNVFSLDIDTKKRIVDLPGYGYAKVSKKIRQKWGRTVNEYLNSRQSLKGLIIVMDIRQSLKKTDIILIEWCVTTNTPVKILLNKADKLSKNRANLELNNVQEVVQRLFKRIEVQLFSAKELIGIEKLKNTLFNWLEV